MEADSIIARLRPWMRRTWLRKAMDELRVLRFSFYTPQRVFSDIYRRNFWRAVEARYRAGPALSQTAHLRLLLQAVIKKYDVQTLLDVPCGDFHWMRQTNFNGCTYIGGDIIPEIVQANSDRFAGPNCTFRQIDILKDRLPKAELLMCRDLFMNLSTVHVRRALSNIKRSDIRFLLTTHYTRAATNEEIATGDWRPINFRLPPFSFPEPLEILAERSSDADDELRGRKALGKSLALWRVTDLPG